MKKQVFTLLVMSTLISAGCANHGTTPDFSDTSDETSQQLGDAMASIDESGGAYGQIALENSIKKTFQRVAKQNLDEHSWQDWLMRPAYANDAGCLLSFGACTSNEIIRTFDGCKMGRATFEGTVDLTWDGTSVNCVLGAAGDSITRVPNFTATGLRGAKLTVTKTGTVGQKLEWISGSGDTRVLSFTNDGINRKFTADGSTLFDFTTKTTAAITITGTDRANRIMDGGKLEVTNNKNDDVCTYIPTDVTWSASTCNCAVSGTWDGTCTGGKTSKVEITGCGTADVTIGEESSSVTFDRCQKS